MIAAQHLLAVAKPDLYRRNPFRVTALYPSAEPGLVDRRRREIAGRGHAEEFWGAFETLDSPGPRLAAELFWLWAPGAGCGCPEEVHTRHDNAVLAHAAVLDIELARTGDPEWRTGLWAVTAHAWRMALAHLGFWEHVRRRAAALAQPRESVAQLRAVFPAALLSPQAELAVTTEQVHLVEALRLWTLPARDVHAAATRAAGPLLSRVHVLRDQVDEHLAEHRPEEAACLAVQRLLPAARTLERALPHRRYGRIAGLREDLAVACHHTALLLPPSSGHRPAVLAAAEELAVREATRESLRRTRAGTTPDRWALVDRLLAEGDHEAAELELLDLRAQAGTSDQERADRLLARHGLGGFRRGRLAGRVLGLAVCLGYAGLIAYGGPLWFGLPPWAVLLVSLVGAPLPLGLLRSRWFREGPQRWELGSGVLLTGLAVLFLVMDLALVDTRTTVAALIGVLAARLAWPGGDR
ncbi:hypothetical protein JOF53_001585 [Crossiella equi]|uniref:Uncharacterized protein n=1 Tax=Crossiella equi TaxID=130796 RepID=A0ABS5A7Z2_9PSEU|nr:hypothetical protein [Crossiella equi]MBP2472713.1 hypothetical protein [Crossiella equi]